MNQVIVYLMSNRWCSNLIAENEGDVAIAMVVCKRYVSLMGARINLTISKFCVQTWVPVPTVA